jgi:PPOX class probable F420-dependent enzyme
MTATMTEARDAFLRAPRIGILATLSERGTPVAVPIWFEWDGQRARIFTGVGSPKVRRLEANPAASLLVANPTGQPEAWVSLEGRIAIVEDGAFDLAERLAHRHWDMSDAAHVETVEGWRAASATLRVLELTPERVRSSGVE